MRALLIPSESEPRAVVVDDANLLAGLQALVGGYIEGVPLVGHSAELTMWCNEEGLLRRLPINVLATRVAVAYGFDPGGALVGDVVVVGPADEDGNDTDVTWTVLRVIQRVVAASGSSAVLRYHGYPVLHSYGGASKAGGGVRGMAPTVGVGVAEGSVAPCGSDTAASMTDPSYTRDMVDAGRGHLLLGDD